MHSFMMDNAYRISWHENARPNWSLTTQRNGNGSRRYYSYGTFEGAYAHASKWQRRVEAEDKRQGRTTAVRTLMTSKARAVAIGTAGS
jgi:hypothetical protein